MREDRRNHPNELPLASWPALFPLAGQISCEIRIPVVEHLDCNAECNAMLKGKHQKETEPEGVHT